MKGGLLHALREDVLDGDERRRKRVFDDFRAEALKVRPGDLDTRFLGINLQPVLQKVRFRLNEYDSSLNKLVKKMKILEKRWLQELRLYVTTDVNDRPESVEGERGSGIVPSSISGSDPSDGAGAGVVRGMEFCPPEGTNNGLATTGSGDNSVLLIEPVHPVDKSDDETGADDTAVDVTSTNGDEEEKHEIVEVSSAAIPRP